MCFDGIEDEDYLVDVEKRFQDRADQLYNGPVLLTVSPSLFLPFDEYIWREVLPNFFHHRPRRMLLAYEYYLR